MDEEYEEIIKKGWSGKKKAVIAILIVILVLLIASSLMYSMVYVAYTPPNTSPIGSLILANATSETTGELMFGTFSPIISYDELIILVYENKTASGYLKFQYSETDLIEWVGGPENSSALYVYYNPRNQKINPGDYIEFQGLLPSTHYFFIFYHQYSQSQLSMVGVHPSFSTTPDSPTLDGIGLSGSFPEYPDYEAPDYNYNSEREMCNTALGIAILMDLFLIVLVAVKME